MIRLPIDLKKNPDMFARFVQSINVNTHSGCWEWKGALLGSGYARLSTAVGGRQVNLRAHRYAYELFNGPIPDELVLDHLCRVRHCVNPRHLEAVTIGENCDRGNRSNQNAGRTHCVHGHELTPANCYYDKSGHRTCKICTKRRGVERSQRLQHAVAE